MNDSIFLSSSVEKKNKHLINIDNIGIYYRDTYDFIYAPKEKIMLLESLISKYKQLDSDFIKSVPPNSFLILYDYKNKKLVVKNDELGHFTLYYYLRDNDWYISNNLPLLKNYLEAKIDKISLCKYIMLDYTLGENTIFENIKKILPSHFLYSKNGATRLLRYSNIHTKLAPLSENFYINKFESIFKDIFENFTGQNIGIMLSGGLDSTLLVSLMKKYNNKVKTYTILDERSMNYLRDNCRKIADYFGTDHQEFKININSYIKYFPNPYHLLNEPIFDIHLPIIYYFFSTIKNDIKFMLHGHSSDTVFGGTPQLVIKRYRRIKEIYRQSDVLTTNNILTRATYSVLTNEIPQKLNSFYNISPTDKINFIFPYLDYRIVKTAFNMPLRFKIKGEIDKLLLRKLSAKIMPYNIAFKKREIITIPNPWIKIIIKKYYSQIKKSLFIKEVFGNIDTFRDKPSFLLKFIIFDIWHNEVSRSKARDI